MAFYPGKIEPSRPCHLLLVGGAAYPNLVKLAELLTPVGRPSEVYEKELRRLKRGKHLNSTSSWLA
jgi:hypothetical protein